MSRESDQVYLECVRFLRSQTRDRNRFRLLYLENCNYGFWRNLLGLRPVGIAVASISVAALVTGVLLDGWSNTSPLVVVVLLLNALLLLMWIGLVGEQSTRRSAEAYSDRLIDAIDVLDDSQASTTV